MSKRRTRDAGVRQGGDDDLIGLTGAFAPVKGAQSVDYDTNDDPVGLTQAFGVIPQDEERSWNEADKWKNFDWNSTDYAADFEDGAEEQYLEAEHDLEPQGTNGKDALILGNAYEDDSVSAHGAHIASGEHNEASSALEASAEKGSISSSDSGDGSASDSHIESSSRTGAPSGKKRSKHARHAAPEPEISPRMRKSQRTRKILIVLVILLVLILAALGYFMYRMYSSSQLEAAQQTQEQIESPRQSIVGNTTDDAQDTTTRLADVPNLAQLLGMNQDEAIAAIGHGALVTSNKEVNEEGNPVKTSLNVALTDETADSRTGTPTVYLDLNEEGKVCQAGYSASASALGFGSLSFADAVNSEHVIEKTLAKAGITVVEGSASLPSSKDDYTSYASDGTTIVRERSSFNGDVDVNGIACEWSAILSYDYTTQVVTGNLNDTVRIVYIYVSMK